MHATSTTTAPAALDTRVECRVCGHKSHSLLDHVLVSHGMTPAAYLSTYPGASTLSEEALAALEERAKTVTKRKAPAAIDLTVKVMGLNLPVDAAVPAEVCLPMPSGYRFPTKGKAKRAFLRAAMALAGGRNCFIWGMPGTGRR